MSSKRIVTVQDGKQTPIESENETLDFASVKIGVNKLEISELDASTLSLNGKKLRSAIATDVLDLTTKGQVDAIATGLQNQVTSSAVSISTLQADVSTLQSGLSTAQSDIVTLLSGGIVYDFDVAAPQTEFVGLSALTALSQIEVLVNGRESREGGGFDFTRNVASTKIVFNNAIQIGAWVRVRVYP